MSLLLGVYNWTLVQSRLCLLDARLSHAARCMEMFETGIVVSGEGRYGFRLTTRLIEALEIYYLYYGDEVMVERPIGSRRMNLSQVAQELGPRLGNIFLPEENGRRPCHGDDRRFAADPHWKDLVLFYEYFHGDTGKGLGASHQTGWTALVTRCFYRSAERFQRCQFQPAQPLPERQLMVVDRTAE